MMSVAQVMSRPVYTCNPTDSLSTAAELMWERGCGSIPVVDEMDALVGMVTDRDICMAAFLEKKPLGAIPVAMAMAKLVHWCKETDSIEAAEQMMRENQIRRVPVVDGNKHPVGVLSLDDLALAAARNEARDEHEFVQTMAAICERSLGSGVLGL